jgi:UrcA family protein
MNRSFIATSFAAFAALGLLAAAPARADDAQTRTLMVRTKGLDLRTASGQAELRVRVAEAAGQVCGPEAKFGDPGYSSYERCLQGALQQASIRVNALIAARTEAARYASN